MIWGMASEQDKAKPLPLSIGKMARESWWPGSFLKLGTVPVCTLLALFVVVMMILALPSGWRWYVARQLSVPGVLIWLWGGCVFLGLLRLSFWRKRDVFMWGVFFILAMHAMLYAMQAIRLIPFGLIRAAGRLVGF